MNTSLSWASRCDRFSLRALARCIDVAICWCGFSLLASLAGGLSAGLHGFLQQPNLTAAIINCLFCFVYYPLTEAAGGSPAKKMLGLATQSTASAQCAIGIASGMLKALQQFWGVAVFYYIILFQDSGAQGICRAIFHADLIMLAVTIAAPVWMLWDRDGLTLHDRVTGSAVRMSFHTPWKAPSANKRHRKFQLKPRTILRIQRQGFRFVR